MDEESTRVLLELERLRGEVTTGFARIDGKFDAFAQQANAQGDDITDLKTEVDKLKTRVWVLTTGAAVLGGGSAGLLKLLGGA